VTLTLRSKVLVYEQVAKNFHFGDAVHHGRFAPRSACGASSSVIASGISRAVLVSLVQIMASDDAHDARIDLHYPLPGWPESAC